MSEKEEFLDAIETEIEFCKERRSALFGEIEAINTMQRRLEQIRDHFKK